MGVVRWSCAAWSCALLLSVPAQAAPHDRGDLEKTQAYLIEQLGKYRDPRAVEASLSFDRCSLQYSYRREFPRLEVRLPGVDLKTIDPRSVKVDESSIEFATFGERKSIEYREALNGMEINHALVSTVQIHLADIPGPVRTRLQTSFGHLLKLCDAKAPRDPLSAPGRSSRASGQEMGRR